MHRSKPLLVLLLALALLAAAPAAAVTVYRSTDAEGRVRFSDQPPPDGAAEALEIEAATPAPSPEVEARRAAMRELTEQMREARLERERTVAPPAAALAAPAPLPPYYPARGYVEEPRGSWLPVYLPYRHHPRFHHHHPRPPHAATPPPHFESLSPRGLRQRLRELR